MSEKIKMNEFDKGVILFKAFEAEDIDFKRTIGNLRIDEATNILTRAIKMVEENE